VLQSLAAGAVTAAMAEVEVMAELEVMAIVVQSVMADAAYLCAKHSSFVDAAETDTNDTSCFAVRIRLERVRKYDAASTLMLAVETDDYRTSFLERNYVRYPTHLHHRCAHNVDC
jgi:hypothetical protein